jgi:hypothetical protein
MDHDNHFDSKCNNNSTKKYLMNSQASKFHANDSVWSECSKNSLNEFSKFEFRSFALNFQSYLK